MSEDATDILSSARGLREQVGGHFHDSLTEALFTDAAQIADRAVTRPDERERFDLDRAIDRIVTSRTWGFPIMILLLTVVFWLTIQGANVPSSMLATVLLDKVHPALNDLGAALRFPWWLSGVLFDGAYLAMAWVISVMLPPMAIFFPLFTLLEDFGYLPRVAFNLDRLFSKAGAHGKQSLSMAMGFGCNAAGVVATRVIDSPRERLIAIITNNFAICNGRWPTLIMVSTIFVGSAVPAALAGLISALAVVGIAVLGVIMTFVVSGFLSRTMLKGEASVFSLELPPYRPPRIWQTIYTSMIDRTLIVLWRAVTMALPAGVVIWAISNVSLGGQSVAERFVAFLNGPGVFIGLNGVILVAYIVAIPANEIIIPTILMLTALTVGLSGVGEGAGVMFDPGSNTAIHDILRAGGWTTITAINLMLFSLLHNPCSTTILTIYTETKSRKWTTVATLLPLALAFGITFMTATVARLMGWA
jgi:ferrous iron transport protein B